MPGEKRQNSFFVPWTFEGMGLAMIRPWYQPQFGRVGIRVGGNLPGVGGGNLRVGLPVDEEQWRLEVLHGVNGCGLVDIQPQQKLGVESRQRHNGPFQWAGEKEELPFHNPAQRCVGAIGHDGLDGGVLSQNKRGGAHGKAHCPDAGGIHSLALLKVAHGCVYVMDLSNSDCGVEAVTLAKVSEVHQ